MPLCSVVTVSPRPLMTDILWLCHARCGWIAAAEKWDGPQFTDPKAPALEVCAASNAW